VPGAVDADNSAISSCGSESDTNVDSIVLSIVKTFHSIFSYFLVVI
jgi:hypothetical protein